MATMWTFHQNDARNTDQAVFFNSHVTNKSLVQSYVTPKWCRVHSSSPNNHLVSASIDRTPLSGLYPLLSDESCMQSKDSDALTHLKKKGSNLL